LSSLAASLAAAEELRVDADAAVRMALAVSQRVVAADARVGAARSTLDAADAARLPVVGTSAGVSQRSAVPEFAAAIEGPAADPVVIFPNIETTYAAAIGVRQPLYAGGGIQGSRRGRHGPPPLTAATSDAVDSDQARVSYWWSVAADAAPRPPRPRSEGLRPPDDVRALRRAGMAVDADVLGAEAQVASARLTRCTATEHERPADLRSLLGLAGDVEPALADRGTHELPPMPAPEELLEAPGSRPELAIADARSRRRCHGAS
jgi:outer membrane protein TolC